jgi:class 3 adenylate cyclase/tetratricopeptide (TPR) repeat protein
MRCPRCQVENREGARFCRECGARLDARCPACGAEAPPASKFCDACGAALEGLTDARFGSPRAYTPRYLAEKILTSRSAIEGERKQVTVLFVDLAGFTSLSERLDPEDVHTMITRAFELMLTEVHRYEGTVNQFLGDGIMALFGAPIAHEDHAARAVLAALGIRAALGRYAEELRARGIRFQVRQALNTGLVVVGGIGSDLRMDYTAVGDTTNVAARLQQAAEPGRILISESTHRLVEGYFHVRSAGPLSLKGKTEPVAAWEVVSARAARSRMDVEAERGLTPFVGREQELRQLDEAFERAAEGHGRVVFLVGEAGIGKSRLLVEFRRRLGDRATWLEGHALSFGESIAFHPLIDLLKRQFRIEDGDSEEAIVGKIERGVLVLGESLRPILPHLRTLMAVDPGDPAVAAMDPRQRRTAIVDALRRLLVRAAEVRPQVIVYEDVHWMDRATEELLQATADAIPTSRILMILSYRPEYTHQLGERTYHTRIGLDVLSPEDSVEMARAMLGATRLPAEVEALLARKAEGNPFFVEEVVKSLRETRVIRPEAGTYVLAREPDAIVVPDTIQGVIMARIDRLDEAPKRTLQIASVIGREFTGRLLGRVVHDIAMPAEEALAVLRSLELVYEKRALPEVSYTFRHALSQEVAYRSLLVHRRKELHRLIGAAIEELYADRLAEHFEVLAHHFLRGEEPGKAVEYLRKAGDKAARAFANREAVALYDQALGLLPEERRAERADLMKKLATVTQYLGDCDASLRHAETAVELYEDLGDKRNAVAMHLHIDVLYNWQWDGAREDWGLKHVEAAAALVEADPDSVEKGLVYQRIAHRYLHRAQPRTTVERAQQAADMFARLGVTMGTSLGTALTCTGRIDDGVAYSERHWEPVQKAGIPVVQAVFGHELALTLALARDVPRARRWGEEVLAAVTKASPVFEAMLRRPLTMIYALSGEIDKARASCQAVEAIEARTLVGCIYEDACSVGLHYLRGGELEEARRYLERMLPLYQERGNQAAVAACALALGQVRLESGEHAGAEDLLQRGLDIARSGANVLVEAWALPLLTELCVVTGQYDRADEHLRRGFELLAPDRNWYGVIAPLHAARGRLAAVHGRWDEAFRSFSAAIAVDRRYDLPWDEARALQGLAATYLARDESGDRERAGQALDEALALFRRVGARRDADSTRARKDALAA